MSYVVPYDLFNNAVHAGRYCEDYSVGRKQHLSRLTSSKCSSELTPFTTSYLQFSRLTFKALQNIHPPKNSIRKLRANPFERLAGYSNMMIGSHN
eukprot:8358203-Pyramimonas_sp.AAC.1